MNHPIEEELFDKVALYLFGDPLKKARTEFSLFLFMEWTKFNMDIVLKAIQSQ